MPGAGWVTRHTRSILASVLALAVAGAFSAILLPTGLFPVVQFPRVLVNVDAGTRPADQTALLVTIPLEQAVRRVPGVLKVRSTTSRGSAEISLDFAWGTDMVAATTQVDAAVAQALPGLPPGTGYQVRRMDPTVFPIIAYSLSSTTVSPIAQRDLVQYQLVPLLTAIPGVAHVGVQGGQVEEVEVLLDPHRLASRGLALSDVALALSKANVLTVVGRMQDHDKLLLLALDDTMRQIQQVRDTVVQAGPGGVVRVSDLAEVRDGVVPQWIRVGEDGHPAVQFQVYQQPNANSVAISAAVRKALAAFQPQMPSGITLSNWYDQSILVTQSASSVRDAILIGLGLAGLVLFAFLRSLRVTLVAMLVVPATLATTVLLLFALGMTFNIMTLGGIAAAVGLVIDDVITMVEHLARRTGVGDADNDGDAVLRAGREFLPPLSGSSTATLLVFLPLVFLTGVTGAFFKALSLTMAAALIISYALTALVVPVLTRLIVDFKRWQDPGVGPEGHVGHAHRWLLARLFARPWLLALGLVPLLVLGWFAYSHVGSGFMPKMDEGGFVLDYRSAPGTSLAETARELRQVEAILRDLPEVRTFSTRTGTALGGGLNEPNTGDFFVRLKSGPRRSIEAVMAEVQDKVDQTIPGLHVATAQLMEDLIGDLTAVPQPIEVKLYANDPAQLAPAARRVAAAIGKVKGLVSVLDGIVIAGDGLNIREDPASAAIEGVDAATVSTALSGYLTGTVATQLPQAVKQIGVRVWLPPGMRQYDDQLAELPIRAPDGHVFALGRVAKVSAAPGQAEIGRENLQRMVAVTARLQGRSLGAAVTDVKKVLDQKGTLPPGVRYELGGLYAQQQIAFAGLTRVFVAALVAEFVLLLFLYERFWIPVIVLGAAALSTTAVFAGLWLTGIELNITAIMGMTMIIGIGTEMAIFLVSEYVDLAREMPPKRALLEAARNRFRPIAMTTLAAILTLMPLALAIGQGSGMQQPLAIAIISGLAVQFPLVLLAMPVLIGLTLSKAERARDEEDVIPNL
ncbi:MAG: efflux RND transporter permease subunit [Alphaproteobacteria bacterium]|nr:efflux RND transporter permease subunit [Alphaproteobacteria bacterium]